VGRQRDGGRKTVLKTGEKRGRGSMVYGKGVDKISGLVERGC